METLKEFWAILVAGATALIWLIRLEAKVNLQAVEMKNMQQQRHEDLDAAKEQRAELNKVLTEIRADVKSLLRERGKD